MPKIIILQEPPDRSAMGESVQAIARKSGDSETQIVTQQPNDDTVHLVFLSGGQFAGVKLSYLDAEALSRDLARALGMRP
jgi:hypothetical protein